MNPMNNEHQMNVKEEQDQEQMTSDDSGWKYVYLKCLVCTINTAKSEISYTLINVDKKKTLRANMLSALQLHSFPHLADPLVE